VAAVLLAGVKNPGQRTGAMENRTQMSKIDSLEPLMIEELRDLLDAERQVTRALPKMARAASAEELRGAFENHLEQTNRQLERLNQAFDHIGERARPKKCVGMQGLIEEGEEMLAEAEQGPARDALLIASAQKVEHYEMAAYGTARTYANLLGHAEVAHLLEQTLDEEKQTDLRLTEIAETVANPRAVQRNRPVAGRPRAASASDRSTSSGRGRASRSQASTRGRVSRGSSGSKRRSR
jgi:ferritin-like metal-binding protein YciE